jgi:hypothetical protein
VAVVGERVLERRHDLQSLLQVLVQSSNAIQSSIVLLWPEGGSVVAYDSTGGLGDLSLNDAHLLLHLGLNECVYQWVHLWVAALDDLLQLVSSQLLRLHQFTILGLRVGLSGWLVVSVLVQLWTDDGVVSYLAGRSLVLRILL